MSAVLDTSKLAVSPAQQQGFAEIPLGQITPDPNQPRKVFDELFLAELADSIKQNGLIQPIVVRHTPPATDGQTHICPYQIIAGETRWRASSIAGLATIPAIIRTDLSDADIVVMQVLENLQRRDLSLIETCEGITRLVQAIGFDKAVAQTGKSKTWVSRHSTLAELPPQVLDLVKANKIDSVDVAKDLAQLVQLDKKAGALMVGRMAGTVTTYGSPINPEQTGSLDDEELTDEERQEERDRLERITRPPTRAEIRTELSTAKAQQERKEAAAAAVQVAKADPAALEAKEAAKKLAEKAKADNQRRLQFMAQKNDFEQVQTTELCAALGIKGSKRQDHGWSHQEPAFINCRENLYPGSSVPAKFDSMKFQLLFNRADAAMLSKLKSAGFTSVIRAHFEYNLELSQHQAEALEKLLGQKAVHFTTYIDCKAAEVPKLIERFKATRDKPQGVPGIARKTMSSIEQFLYSDAVIDKHGGQIKAGDLHAAYATWCEKKKLTALSLNSNEYGAAFTEMQIEKKRLKTGWHYLDIALA